MTRHSDGQPVAEQTASGRSLSDPIFRWALFGSAATVLVILGLMIGSTTFDSIGVFVHQGLVSFLTGTTWDPGQSRTDITGTYEASVFIYGTMVTSLIAIVLALPVSVGDCALPDRFRAASAGAPARLHGRAPGSGP